MPFPSSRARRVRLRRAALFAAAVAVALSCSSDPDGPVGSDMDLLGSEPGDVFQDTIAIHADTVLAFNSLITGPTTLEFGRSAGYTRAIIMNIPFAETVADVGRTVATARLRLRASDIGSASFPARFYLLRNSYEEGDSIPFLDTLAVIPDATGETERTLQDFPPTYTLPSALVQSWVGEDTARAIAIVYTDDVNDRTAEFFSHEATTDGPRIEIVYTDNSLRHLDADADGVFIRPTGTTSNLIISDGYVRRVYFRVRLEELAEESAVHTARARFHIVPGTLVGTNTTAVVYVPNSPDPASKEFLTGQLVTNVDIFDGDETVEFPLTNSIFLTLQGSLQDNGFVIRFESENTEVRQVEFYGTAAAEPLRPLVYITSSTPANFDP